MLKISELNPVCHDSTTALSLQSPTLYACNQQSFGTHTESLQPRDDDNSSNSSSEDEHEDRQAPVLASNDNFRGVGVDNGSRGNNLGRLLRSVHRGATCWLRTGAVWTCAVLWSLCYACVSCGWGMSCLSCGYYHGNAYFYSAPKRWPESWPT